MDKYENFRENGWKLAWKDHPFFQGDSPVAKVHSPFVKRTRIDDNGGSAVPKEVEWSYEVTLGWLEERLTYVYRYNKNWNDYTVYQTVAVQEYVKQIKNGGFKGGIISSAEYALLMPNKK